MAQRESCDAQRQPGYQAVYSVAVPLGYVNLEDQIGLVFRYAAQPRVTRERTAQDRAQIKDQMTFVHWLGYCNLEITDRNVRQADDNTCYLLDYRGVRAIRRSSPWPGASDSSELTARCNAGGVQQDLHLWYQLQDTFFKDLPADDACPAAMDEKQQITAAAAGNTVPMDDLCGQLLSC